MSQRLIVVGGLFLVLLVVLLIVPPSDQRQVPLTVYSAEPGGAKALRLWLEAMGYQVTTLEGDRYVVGRDIRTVLVLAPTEELGTAAIDELERWTRQGGRLVIAAEGNLAAGRLRVPTVGTPVSELLRRFDLSLRPLSGVTQAVPAEPGLLDPAIQSVAVTPSFELNLRDRAGETRPLLVGQEGSSDGVPPVLAASIPVDRGELVVLTVPQVLSNGSLHDETNARLALSLVGPRERGKVAFDELHHGFGSRGRRNLYALLLEQSWGRAALLAGVLVLLFLLLRGRRLGRPVPVFVDRGRSLGELVTSQASLFRAGGKRAFVADHVACQLRHDLTRSLGLPADVPDHEITARASAMGHDPTGALQIVQQTRNARSDRELLTLAREGAAAQTGLRRPHPDKEP